MKIKILFVLGVAVFSLGCTRGENSETTDEEVEWEVVWQDSFDQDGVLDPTKWNVVSRGVVDWNDSMSDHEDCIIIRDGHVYLRGIVNSDRPEDPSPYLTGGISTEGKFSFAHGKVEIRAKLENAQGAWPAMWLKPAGPKELLTSPAGEIDIMEHLNNDNKVYQVVHSYYTLELGKKHDPYWHGTPSLETEDFNVYGLEWFPDKLVFTLNGEETFVYPRVHGVDPSQWPFDESFFLIIDMQLGGSWVGPVDLDDLPVQMIVDWVKISRQVDAPFTSEPALP